MLNLPMLRVHAELFRGDSWTVNFNRLLQFRRARCRSWLETTRFWRPFSYVGAPCQCMVVPKAMVPMHMVMVPFSLIWCQLEPAPVLPGDGAPLSGDGASLTDIDAPLF